MQWFCAHTLVHADIYGGDLLRRVVFTLCEVQQARMQIKSRLEEGGGGSAGSAVLASPSTLEIDAVAHKAIVELLPLISESLASTNAQIDAINAIKLIAATDTAARGGGEAGEGRGSMASGGGGGGGGGKHDRSRDSDNTMPRRADLLGEQLDAGSRELELCSALRQVVLDLRSSSARERAD